MCCGIGRVGVGGGLLALAVLLLALFTNAWVYTREPVSYTSSSPDLTSPSVVPVTFRIGLWRVCPMIKRHVANLSTTTSTSSSTPPFLPCSGIRYTSSDDMTYTDLGLAEQSGPGAPPAYTPLFLSKMRWATPLCVTSCVLVAFATILAVAGHCCQDHKTLVACGFYIIGGLTLGGGLVVFASLLSDVYLERPRLSRSGRGPSIENSVDSPGPPGFEYKYGWSYLLAGFAFILTELAAVLNVTAYLRRFPTVEDMVRTMVPGAERRLREHQGLAGDYLVQHRHKYQRHKTDGSMLTSGLSARCFNQNLVVGGENDAEVVVTGVEGSAKPAPDICTQGHNRHLHSAPANTTASGGSGSYLMDDPPDDSADLAGQTVPIVLMHHRTATADRYSTLPHKPRGAPPALVPLPPMAGTLPPKHRNVGSGATSSGVVTLDAHAFAEHLHRKDIEGHMTLNQRFGYALSSGLDSGTGTLVSQDPTLPHKKKQISSATANPSLFNTMDPTSGMSGELLGVGSASVV